MITNEEQEIKELWSQAKRAAQALQDAISAGNKEAAKMHRSVLLDLLEELQKEQ